MSPIVFLSLALVQGVGPYPEYPLPERQPAALDHLVAALAVGLIDEEDSVSPADMFELVVSGDDPVSAPLRRAVEQGLEIALQRAGLPARRLQEGEASLRIDVTLELLDTAVAARATMRRLGGSIWSRLVYPQGEMVTSARASVAFDQELRHLAGRAQAAVPWREGNESFRDIDLNESDLSGEKFLALGTLRGLEEGATQWIALTPRDVLVLEEGEPGNRMQVVQRISLLGLSPAPQRERQAWGSLAVIDTTSGQRGIVVSTSDRAQTGVFIETHLGWELKHTIARQRTLYKVAPTSWLSVLSSPNAGFQGRDLQRVDLEGEALTTRVTPGLDGLLGGPLALRSLAATWSGYPRHGGQRAYLLAQTLTGDAVLFSGPEASSLTKHASIVAGDVYAFTDLNGDGSPELAVNAHADSRADQVTVYDLARQGRAEAVSRFKIPGRLSAMAPAALRKGRQGRMLCAYVQGYRSRLGWLHYRGLP
jgi:hypothetical protein